MSDDRQQTWDDYYQRIRRRRIRGVEIVHAQMSEDDLTDSTVLAIDFRHFSRDEDSIRNLATQLSEHYATTITRSESDSRYWVLDGTTRPDGIDGMTEQRCVDWVSFMCDVAQSHGCVFSTWRLTDLRRARSWSNEMLDVDPEVESK
jgi:hypothetical protein